MSRRRQHRRLRRPVSEARHVKFEWSASDGEDDSMLDPRVEDDIEQTLAKARLAGLVSEYDTGRGRGVWLCAAAGAESRELKRFIEARLPKTWTKGSGT